MVFNSLRVLSLPVCCFPRVLTCLTGSPKTGSGEIHPAHHLFLSLTDMAKNSPLKRGNMDQYQFGDPDPSLCVKAGNLKAYEVFHVTWPCSLTCLKTLTLSVLRPLCTKSCKQSRQVVAHLSQRWWWPAPTSLSLCQSTAMANWACNCWHDSAAKSKDLRLQFWKASC